MYINLKASLDLAPLKNFQEDLRQPLRDLSMETAERLASWYSRKVPKKTGALAESFYVVGRTRSTYAEAATNFERIRVRMWAYPEVNRPTSDYHAKVSSTAFYLFDVDRVRPFIQEGLMKAGEFHKKRMEEILKDAN